MRALISSLILLLSTATSQAADVDWSGWSFNYSTDNNSSGLVLTDVSFNNNKLLGKVSMPVMRVEYENDICGPYADIMGPTALRNPLNGAQIEACNNQAVCRRTFSVNGENMLEVGANWQIGEYQIYQTYYFSENGYMDSRVYSRGLQCQIQHNHHGQWMFDFDIDGSANDQLARGDSDVQITEFNDLKTNTDYWTVQDKNTGNSVRLTPAGDDGEPDNFAKYDFAARAFNAEEVGRWRYGARGEIGTLFNSPAQNIDGTDLVVWYVSHLPHSPEEGAAIWHASGPRITVTGQSIEPAPAPAPAPQPAPEPASGNNVLVNGGFETPAFAGWNSCGPADNIEYVLNGQSDGVGAARISGGGCLYQEVAAQANDSFQLSCDARLNGTGWTIVELSYLDANFENLLTDVAQVSSSSAYANYQLGAVAPEGTAHVAALLYSEANTYFDSCSLTPVASTAPTPATAPAPAPSANLLANGGFENNLTAWSSCGATTLPGVSTDADTGSSALTVNNSGCMYQEFTIEPGTTYSMDCRAKSEDPLFYTSVSLTLLDSNYAALENVELPVETPAFANVTAQLTAPANSRFGSVVLYSDDVGTFDNCVVTSN